MPSNALDRRSGSERRMRARYKVQVPFVLKSDEGEVHGTTRNISLLGISACSDSPVSQVHPVQCVMSLPEFQKPLIAKGTVIRCEPVSQNQPEGSHEIGVFFKEFEGTGETDLIRFLTQVLQQEQSAIQAGYRALKQRVAARKKKKRLEAQEKRKRKLKRLRRRKARLAKQQKKKSRKRSSARPKKR